MSRWPAKEAMQERILDTAGRLFYGQGIRAVGVDTIAAEIGISKRTLYNYFPSKDELIVAYLSRTYSTREKSLIPEPQRDFAAWLEWSFFIVAELDSTSLYVMRRHGADALGHIYGVAPDVVAKAGEYFRQQLRHVEVALADGRTYLMGDRFTSADILLTTCLDWAIAYGVGICDNAHPYLARIQQRPAYRLGHAANVARAAGAPAR